MEKYFEIPDAKLPSMKLYYALHEIGLQYDKNKWNGDVLHQIYVEMYCIKNKLYKPDDYTRLERFLKEIQEKPTVMPKGMRFDYQQWKWV